MVACLPSLVQTIGEMEKTLGMPLLGHSRTLGVGACRETLVPAALVPPIFFSLAPAMHVCGDDGTALFIRLGGGVLLCRLWSRWMEESEYCLRILFGY